MTNETARENVKQAFRARSASDIFYIQTKLDKVTSQRFILWRDILKLFPNAKWVFSGSEMMTFMTGDDYEDLIPERIEYHPDITLEVVADNTVNSDAASGDIPASSSQEFGLEVDSLRIGEAISDVTHLLTGDIPGTKSSQSQEDIPVTSSHFRDHSANSSLVVYSPATNHGDSQMTLENFDQLHQSYLQAIKSNQAELATWLAANMTKQFEELKIQMDKNAVLQQQMNQMQKKYNEEQQQMIRDLEGKQQEVISLNLQIRDMNKQTLDRLAIIQNHVQSLLTQTFELHEYPIPRLFIILPKPSRRRDAFGKLFSSQFKLFFLCECGDHTRSRFEGSTISHEIHLAKHEGYDITKPNEFFEKYGSYILTVMQMFKYGIIAAGVVVPSLEKFKIIEGMDAIQEYLELADTTIGVLVDDAISFLEQQQNDPSNGIDATGQARFKELEVLEGAELRQLQSYLSIKDKGRVLGNLYRIVTEKGHVKWVCNDHYRDNYRAKAISDLRDTVWANGGTFDENIGKITIRVSSPIQARQFYEALTKAHGIQELEIGLDWDVTMDDLRKFANAISRANISHLTISRFEWEGPTLDFVNSGRRYSPIIQLVSNERIQSLSLHNFSEFFKRVGSSWTTSRQLRVLTVHEDIKLEDGASKSYLTRICRYYPDLTELRLSTRQLDSLVEFLIDTLGYPHHQVAKATDLLIHGGPGYTEVKLKFSLQKRTSPQTRKLLPSKVTKSTIRTEATPDDQRTNLSIEIFSRNNEYLTKHIRHLYPKYDWSIEHLDVQGFEFLTQHLTTAFLDELTEKRPPKYTSMRGLVVSSLTVEDLQKIERVVERSRVVKALGIYFDNREVGKAREKLEYLHGPIGERLTDLEFEKYFFPDPYIPGASEASSYSVDTPIDHSFPNLETFKFFPRLLISDGWAGYIAAVIASPSQTTRFVLNSGVETPDVSTSQPSESITNAPKARKHLREFRFAHGHLEREGWATVISALNFSTLEIVVFESCNFSLEQLETLVACVPREDERSSVGSLHELHLLKTRLPEDEDENNDSVQELLVRLREKIPQIKIIQKN